MTKDMWSEEAEADFIRRNPNGFKSFFYNPATIDNKGFRHVFCVENARGVRKYFDKSEDALALARTAKFTPCHLYDMPILPRWEYHTMDIDSLALLIENKLLGNDDNE